MNITKMFNAKPLGEPKEDEYEIEGLPYCSKCNTPRFVKLRNNDGSDFITRCLCKCQAEERDANLLEKEQQKLKDNFRERQKISMMGEKYLDARFDTAVRTDSNQKIYSSCENYVKNASQVLTNNIGIYIYGNNSSGKTYLTACMCNALVEKGYTCVFTSMPKIISEIQKSYNNNAALSQAEVVEMLSRKQFLFIDDLGKEFIGQNKSAFAEKVLLEVLNTRYNNGLPTIFSSNFSLTDFIEKLDVDKAISERVNEMSTRVFRLEGDNFRNEALKDKTKIAKSLGI